jgi:hypothetical protein
MNEMALGRHVLAGQNIFPDLENWGRVFRLLISQFVKIEFSELWRVRVPARCMFWAKVYKKEQ